MLLQHAVDLMEASNMSPAMHVQGLLLDSLRYVG